MLLSTQQLLRYRTRLFVAGLALVFIVMTVSLAFGAVPIRFSQLVACVLGQADPQTQLIITALRLPRVMLAGGVGALLASCGAVTQGLFRNPLADPSLIGVTAGASVGASLAIVFLTEYENVLSGLSMVSTGAFIGAIVAVFSVYRVATSINGTSVTTMLLMGLAVTFLAGSMASFLEYISDNDMLRRMSLWRMGGFDGADYTRVTMIALVLMGCLVVLVPQFEALNAMLLGESEARYLGVDTHRVKKITIIVVAAGVGVSVALVGTIAFVGLLVPHMVRLCVGPNHRLLVPFCALCGAILLVIADSFARVIIAPTEIPVGLMTTFLGAPLFIYILSQRRLVD